MDLTKTPGELATDAAEAIRALNHRTLSSDESYEQVPEVGATAYALRTLIERLPQSLDQMDNALLRFETRAAIRMDDGTEAVVAVADCGAAITQAKKLLAELLEELAIVSARASHMGGHWPDEDEAQEGQHEGLFPDHVWEKQSPVAE